MGELQEEVTKLAAMLPHWQAKISVALNYFMPKDYCHTFGVVMDGF